MKTPQFSTEMVEAAKEAADLVRHIRKLVRAENAHLRRSRSGGSQRDSIDWVQARLYEDWPAKRLDVLLATLNSIQGTDK